MKFTVIVLILFFYPCIFISQTDSLKQPNYYDEKLHIGYGFSLNTSNDRIKPIPDLKTNQAPTVGFGFNAVLDYALSEKSSIRTLPGISIRATKMDFDLEVNGETIKYTQRYEFSNIDIPIEFQYRMSRKQNRQFHFLAGASYSYSIVNDLRVFDGTNKPVLNKLFNRNNISLYPGLGVDFFKAHHKLSFVLKYDISLVNVYYNESTKPQGLLPNAAPFYKYNKNSIVLMFLLEGIIAK